MLEISAIQQSNQYKKRQIWNVEMFNVSYKIAFIIEKRILRIIKKTIENKSMERRKNVQSKHCNLGVTSFRQPGEF